ncbi:MAG: homoserine dehydrogenase [Candidatus Wallbacteria bacterium]
MKIAILGFGNIGTRLYEEILFFHKNIEVVKILVQNVKKTRPVAFGGITSDFGKILKDKSIDTVVDVTCGTGSLEYIRKSLEAGKNVITANKLAVSEAGAEFIKLAKEKNINFYFEACVGGGIPIVNLFNENFKFHRIKKVTGILNGTTNYILTQMADEGMDFKSALILAQEKGFAEPDPTFDISGKDAAYKVSILKDLLFESKTHIDDILCKGIHNISSADLNYAKSIGCSIKLLGTIETVDNKLALSVQPIFLRNSHPLANVKNEFNALFIEGEPIGEIMLFGRGAGAGPTTASLISDILRIERHEEVIFNESYAGIKPKCELIDINSRVQPNYLRLKVLDIPGVISKIAACFESNEISIASMEQKTALEGSPVDVIFTTHPCSYGIFNEMLKQIKNFDFILDEPVWFKIAN